MMKLLIIALFINLISARPVRRMHFGTFNGVGYSSGYVYTVSQTNITQPLQPKQHDPVQEFDPGQDPTISHERQVCRFIKVQSAYPNITMKANTNTHTFDMDLNYFITDMFGTNYMANPELQIMQNDMVLETYTMNDIFKLMNYQAWDAFDDFVEFTFSGCMTISDLKNNITALNNNPYVSLISSKNNQQFNAFENITFAKTSSTDKMRNAIGCLDDIDCIINWCNSGHSNTQKYMYYLDQQTCVYPTNTRTKPSDELNFVFNVDLWGKEFNNW